MKQQDLETLLLCSVKYAIGRETYIVGEICDIIRSQERLSKKCLDNIIKTIERAKEEEKDYYGMSEPFGDDCDKQNWLDLLEWCKNKLKEGRK